MKEEIAVRVDWKRFKSVLAITGITQEDLSAELGVSRVFFQNWMARRGGFPQRVVDFLETKGILAAAYEAKDATMGSDTKQIEDAFVRALERFYGVKEGEYERWFITTMNAVTKNACREVLHDTKV